MQLSYVQKKLFKEFVSQFEIEEPLYVVDLEISKFYPDSNGNMLKCFGLGAKIYSLEDMIDKYNQLGLLKLPEYNDSLGSSINGIEITDEDSYLKAYKICAERGIVKAEWQHTKIFATEFNVNKFLENVSTPYRIVKFYPIDEQYLELLEYLKANLPTEQTSLFNDTDAENKKIYIVKKGRKPGIYHSWNECKEQIDGYSGAIYKSFMKSEEATALAYLESDKEEEEPDPEDLTFAYVDGSFNQSEQLYGYGGLIVFPNGQRDILIGNGNDPDMLPMRNVAGEISGAMAAISVALKNHSKVLDIYYDYEGIGSWANGLWKTNKAGTIAYAKFVRDARAKGLKINFMHVYGHSGVDGNEISDKLAKESVNLGKSNVNISEVKAWRYIKEKENE